MTLVCFKHINRQTNGTEQIQKYTTIQRIKEFIKLVSKINEGKMRYYF